MVLVYLLLGWLLLSLPAAVLIGRSIHFGTSAAGVAVPREQARRAAGDGVEPGALPAALRSRLAARTLTS